MRAKASRQVSYLLVALLHDQLLLVDKLLKLFAPLAFHIAKFLDAAFVANRQIFDQNQLGPQGIHGALVFGQLCLNLHQPPRIGPPLLFQKGQPPVRLFQFFGQIIHLLVQRPHGIGQPFPFRFQAAEGCHLFFQSAELFR